MLAMDTIKLEKLPTKQDGRQHTSPLKYDKTKLHKKEMEQG